MSGRSDFQVTATGAAAVPSSFSARGKTRVFSDGRRYTVGGSIRNIVAGPLPAVCPLKGSAPPASADARPAAAALAAGAPAAGAAAPPTGPTTWTAACPFRVPARASMRATPPPTPVTVPLLPTFATEIGRAHV